MAPDPKIDLTSAIFLMVLAMIWGCSFFLAAIALRENPNQHHFVSCGARTACTCVIYLDQGHSIATKSHDLARLSRDGRAKQCDTISTNILEPNVDYVWTG